MAEIYSFGYWVLRRRKALDLTREELATRVGCAPETIKKIERDERRPSRQIAELLANALGVLPEEYEHFLQSARGERSVDGLQLPSQSLNPFPPPHNLPSQLTSFIGREKEIETVKQLIAPHGRGRLLILTGAGGSGKTRLALQVAHATLDVFPDSVWFIDFASLTDPALVPQSLLTTLGLSEQAGRSNLAIVSNFLQPKRALLILDNCEHLIQACAQLAETLLRTCPALHILATSREALGIAGETPYLVPTLTTPDPAQADLDSLTQYEAVQLFVERAQTALPGFALTADNTLAVAQVCQQLDGIPLALELAAARVKALRVEQIAARLAEHEQFRLLTTGSRTALPRHQTLHALIDWSHDLLLEPERVLFRRLAVFTGGWTLEAAEAVCVGKAVEANAVLDLMTQLVNKSLIIIERAQGQEARYRLLETIRQYANERLLKAGEVERLRNRHFDFFLRWAERVEPLVRGPQQLTWLDLLEADNDNLRAALEWSLAQAEHGEASLRLAGALLMFWSRRGHMSEGHAWLSRALVSQNAPSAGTARAKALYVAGTLAQRQGSNTAKALLEESAGVWQALGSAGKNGLAYALATLSEAMQQGGEGVTARSLASEAVRLFREQDDRWGLAFALSHLGLAIRDQEDFALARSVLNESVAIWRNLGDLWGLKLATRSLGFVAMRQGDYEVTQSHFADCLAIARKLGDQEAVAIALYGLGRATLNMGDRVQAKIYFAESYSLFGESDNKSWQADCLYCLGLLAQFEGDHQQAKIFHKQVLALAHEVGPAWLRADALMGLAGVAAANGLARRAGRLLGAADAQLEACTSYWDAAESRIVERAIASAVAQLGEAAFAVVRAEGRTMAFEQAADYAMETDPSA
jgi:predicted ATPase/transcriptional regulator with XRE-family HTH domain